MQGKSIVCLSLVPAIFLGCAARPPATAVAPPPPAAEAAAPPDELLAEVRATAAAARAIAEASETAGASLQLIADRLAALEPTLAAALSPRDQDHDRRGVDVAALRKVVLPREPSAEDVAAYVSQIGVVTQRQRQRSSDDPQTAMLAEAGRHHLEPLVDAVGMSDTMDHYLLQAIRVAATDADKTAVLSALVRKPQLIDVISARGWLEEAKPILLAEVKNGRAVSNRNWLRTLGQVRDAEIEEVLVESFIAGPNRPATFQMIQHQRGLDLGFVVAEAWSKARLDTQQERMQLAPLALSWGNEEALTLLVDGLPPTPPPGQHHGWHGSSADARSTLLIHLDFYGTNEEIREWYKANHGNLRFDPEKRRFRIAEDADASDE